MWFKSNFTTPAVAAISFCLIGGTSPAPAYADLGDQLFKLLPDDGALNDQFGWSVAISGATAIIGGTDDSAYLFDITTGDQLFKLLPKDGGKFCSSFGTSVAISGTTAIVGDWEDEDNGFAAGSAYLFDTTTGQQLFKLVANDGAADDELGGSVAISGTIAIAGAQWDDDNGIFSGSAYLFDTATGKQLFKLLPIDGAAGDVFGRSVAISGATAIVGSPNHDANDDFDNNAGSAYLFDTTTGLQLFKLLPDDGAAFDRFGISVGISGTTAIVGSWLDDDNGDNSGSAYLFNTTTGKQVFKLLPDDGAATDYFADTVAINGTIAIAGARGDDDNGLNSGSAYLFDTTTGRQLFKILPKDGATEDIFGHSVAISGTTAIVGSPNDDDNGEISGSAYLFDAVANTCPWDLDDNGSVGAADLLALLASWGPCKGCPADFDGNGSVGASDLLALLANWGPCP